MPETAFLTVLLKIVAMFLVILVGWVARRRMYLTKETTGTMSRFVVGIAMPAMIFASMLRTVDPKTLWHSWYIPVIGAVILLVGYLVGLLTGPLFSDRSTRPTFIFLTAIANWVYLPLPIVVALYGDAGVRDLLLMNVGSVLVLWSLGVWTLQGGKPNLKSLCNLALNPGLLATLLGIVAALTIPAANMLEVGNLASASVMTLLASTVVQAMAMVGSLTIPLSLVVTGAQLGELDLAEHRFSRPLAGVLASRLVLSPIVCIALVIGLWQLGYLIPDGPRMVGFLVAAMPVAVSCSIFTEQFGGDTPLAAQSIFYSTLLSIASVPVLLFAITHLGQFVPALSGQ